MLILGIETSCDETAAAILKDGQKILSNVVFSQTKLHASYGGVVPEIASRAHILKIILIVNEAIKAAGIEKEDLDCIAVATGPGLITSLMIGVDTARTLAYSLNKPLIGVNHIEGHIASCFLNSDFKDCNIFPAICLTVSGGHTMLVLVKEWGKYQVLGETLDDACGEAFDKVAKLLKLGYPGGPNIEKEAKFGNREAYCFPRPMLNADNLDFSFSGLKTAVLYELKKIKKMNKKIVQDICASFQEAAFEVLVKKTLKAAKHYEIKRIMLAGGVAGNKMLKNKFRQLLPKDYVFLVTRFSTDNAAMIAKAAYWRAINKDYDHWQNLTADANLGFNSRV